jgi:hypothetical protein
MKILFYISLSIIQIISFAYDSCAQVSLTKPLILSSIGDSAKVENLYTPNELNAGLTIGSVQSNRFLYATSIGTDSIILNLSVIPESLLPGMVIYFKSQGTNSDSIHVSIDHTNYFPLYKNINIPLKSGDIKSGQMLAIGFDGNHFQYLNYENKDCPSGFLPVTSEYCIEINESTVAFPYYDALVDCYSKNARMCNWGEWHYACISLGANLNNMTNNWEYTDDAGNEVNMVRITGNGSCVASGLQDIPVNLPKKHRCCYSLK